MSEKTLSRIAWENYRTFIEPDLSESFLDSEWESMHPKHKTAWDAVVMSILPKPRQLIQTMSTAKTPGQIAWEVFIEGFDAEWGNQRKDVKDLWHKVAQVVLDAQPCVHPFNQVNWRPQNNSSWNRVYKCNKCGKEL